MADWSVRPLVVPPSFDGPGSGLLRGLVEANNEVLLDSWGTRDFFRWAREVHGELRDQRYVERVRLLAVDDAADEDDPRAVLGYACLDLPRFDNTHTGEMELGVRPAARGRGIGSALHDAALAAARERGRTTMIVTTDQAAEPPPGPGTLSPATGAGAVLESDRGVQFALARGWALEQVERFSALDLPMDPARLDAFLAGARARAGAEYRLVQWEDACPERWLDDFAELNTRMSTDAPLGGLDIQEDRWDAGRVRDKESHLAERGIRLVVTAAQHAPSGHLVAFTDVFCRPDDEDFVDQGDTLVVKAHRGRRLGMLVKAANLQHLARVRPQTRRIGTWNAEENAWMLAVNVELGFRPAGGGGEWQKRL